MQLVPGRVPRCLSGRAAATIPATPSATSVVPRRQARPKESETTTPTSTPASSRIRSRRRRAEASGSSGRRTSVPGPFAFDASTPADAHTNPCRVSAITSGGRLRRISLLSRRTTSSRRASSSPASSRARSEGSTSSSETTRPSTFETAFCATTRTSRSSNAAASSQQRSEVVALLELGDPAHRDDAQLAAQSMRSRKPGDPDAGVPAIALVQVDDHGRHPLERAGARERAGVERAPGDEPLRKLQRERLRVRVVTADERVLVGRLVRAERRRPRASAAPRERDPRARPGRARRARCASGEGSTPTGANRSSDATESTGVEPIAPERSRAVSSAASAFVARTTRSTACTASSFAAPLRADLGSNCRGALRVSRADDDLVLAPGEARRERLAERPSPPDDRYPHATSRTSPPAAVPRHGRASASA